MKVLICGSRGFSNYNLLETVLDEIHAAMPIKEVVSGGAKGGDSLGEQWAYKNNVPIKQFLPDWKLYGKSAGFRRNKEMLRYIYPKKNRLVVAFWDGESHGTAHTIEEATAMHIVVKIVRY